MRSNYKEKIKGISARVIATHFKGTGVPTSIERFSKGFLLNSYPSQYERKKNK